jgi:hypothetical protein
MQVVNDCGNHGYTVDDTGTTWYWKVVDDEVEFRRNAGYPVNHPLNNDEPIPKSVIEHTRKQAAALVSAPHTVSKQ